MARSTDKGNKEKKGEWRIVLCSTNVPSVGFMDLGWRSRFGRVLRDGYAGEMENLMLSRRNENAGVKSISARAQRGGRNGKGRDDVSVGRGPTCRVY